MTMTHRVLIVCADNACTSPYLAGALAMALARGPQNVEWDISTRGVGGRPGQAMCEASAAQLPAGAADWSAAHVTGALTASDVRWAHLILTATAADRSAVSRLSPDARSRTFTVREAVQLGAEPLSDGELRAATVPGRATASLRTYADALNARRGTVQMPKARWSFLRAEEPSDPLDLPDPHRPVKRHERALDHIDAQAEALARSFAGFVRAVTRRTDDRTAPSPELAG